jgi:hypothetical protein
MEGKPQPFLSVSPVVTAVTTDDGIRQLAVTWETEHVDDYHFEVRACEREVEDEQGRKLGQPMYTFQRNEDNLIRIQQYMQRYEKEADQPTPKQESEPQPKELTHAAN